MTASRLQHIQEMLAKEPDDSFLTYALALEYAALNNLTRAIEVIEKLIERDASYLGAYYQLGQYYEQVGSIQKAEAVYTKGVAVAKQQNNKKILGELNTALALLDE